MTEREKVLTVAKKQLNYLEKETNKNLDSKTGNAGDNNYTKYARDFDTKYKTFYNGKKQGAAWCDIFVDWCFVEALGEKRALELLCQPKKSCGAGCGWSADYYKAKGRFGKKAMVGAQIFFKDRSGEACHTGLVTKVGTKYVYTIEGNTSSAPGVVANGGAVAEKKYLLNDSCIFGYGYPAYNDRVVEAPVREPEENKVLEWQIAAILDGFQFPKYGADGDWGAECESVAKIAVVMRREAYYYPELTKIVQRAVGLKGKEVDGKCGAKTTAAIKVYQSNNGLKVDGKCGLNTWRKILGVT
jgi:peptidoglycan hydrolase-like protein with peptidoglycan-binding domain